MTRAAAALLAAALATLTACTTVTDGSPRTVPVVSTSTTVTVTAPATPTTPTTSPSTTTRSGGSTRSSSPTAGGTPCPGSDAKAVVTCLNRSLSTYWTHTLVRTVRFVAVADPTAAQVPKDCRSGLTLHSAFTCPVDGNVYVTKPFLLGLAKVAPSSDLALRLASTMAHEAGHVVQLVERYPPILHGKGDASSRTVEQQADCLSGVWAHAIGIPDADFLRGARVVLGYVDNAFERRTHGTIAVRLKQIRRGQAGHTAQSCGLTVH